MITIDCREGGGQMVRTALALSALTGKPFCAVKIRHSRPQPGLKAQHVSCVEALQELCFAKARGSYPGSENLEFVPGTVVPRTISIDIGTAGSITLLLQSLLLPAVFAEAKVRLRIRGGTDTRWAMPLDFLLNLVLPAYEGHASFKVNEARRGYYPKGDGFLDITIVPGHTAVPLQLESKKAFDKIKGVSNASANLREADVAKRQAAGARRKLSQLGYPVKISEEYSETLSTGTVITLYAGSVGADALGERGRRAEDVGAEAAMKLIEVLRTPAAVDPHLADNLVPLLGIVGGCMRTNQMTGHIRSNIKVCEQFLGKVFEIDDGTISARIRNVRQVNP